MKCTDIPSQIIQYKYSMILYLWLWMGVENIWMGEEWEPPWSFLQVHHSTTSTMNIIKPTFGKSKVQHSAQMVGELEMPAIPWYTRVYYYKLIYHLNLNQFCDILIIQVILTLYKLQPHDINKNIFFKRLGSKERLHFCTLTFSFEQLYNIIT